ncbi:hypothetical protein RchiOBHm_Chr2g0152841 [Rosa chinensis]|uniref:Uncharacterized protein n=1 Tax=Rosa chinensis TaxID=74649 RepID=A0A2P6S0M4_ROSCH|nr:hypothetical protein RchiOBHm_Chr2g0152841 [Rosa chinensis]
MRIEEHLDAVSVKDNSRVMLLQEPKRKERSVGELNESETLSDAGGGGGGGETERECFSCVGCGRERMRQKSIGG